MRRRDFLVTSSSAALAPFLPQLQALAQAQGQLKFIDAHCHLFNAQDLPLQGFIQKVVLPSDNRLKQEFEKHPGAFIGLLTLLVPFVRNRTPTPEKENLALREAARRGERTDAERRQTDLDVLEDLVDHLKLPDEVRRNSPYPYVALLIVDTIRRALFSELINGYNESDPGHVEPSSRWVAERVLATNKTFARALKWALLFTRYRHELADQLNAYHRNRIALMTPALVDFSLWVDDLSHKSIADQVDAMRYVSLRPKGPRVHGFVPFCPLRHATWRKNRKKGGEPDPLSIVKQAITGDGAEKGKGFIGVKLYPPMGFQASGNAKLGNEFPHRTGIAVFGSRTGEEIDASLEELFRWCGENDVPIMTHTNNSWGSGFDSKNRSYSLRADPKFWRPVFASAYGAKLRVNFAHFGDFGEGKIVKNSFDRASLDKTWEWEIGRLCNEYKTAKIYADLSYFSEIYDLEAAGKLDAILSAFSQFGTSFDVTKKRLIYGSDWTMLGIEEKFSNRYPDDVVATLQKTIYKDSVNDIIFNNAVDFLGLKPGEKTRERLEKFYRDNDAEVQAGWLKVFA